MRNQQHLRALAEDVVSATLPLLPLSGSWDAGYTVNDEIHPTLRATPEEWAEAAHAVAVLQRALNQEEVGDAG